MAQMTKPSDGVPEPVAWSERSKRATTEFCSEECDGYRCMLVKGHSGMHECLATKGLTRWPAARAS